ncbi:MAG: DUF354 domain-containing protein, partial [Gammaproteobacteria bacterium]|nr:DUF354 domain-containing protein [Gammaproteobacteria bacterium]
MKDQQLNKEYVLEVPDGNRIWIDLDNSPHVPFFKPIATELNKRGYQVTLTARNCAQTCELADLFKLRYKQIGHHYGKNKVLKLFGTVFRSLQMAPWVLRQKPDLALSHGSRSQILIASLTRIPSALIADYEHAQFLPLVYPTWVIAPEMIPDSQLPACAKGTRKYPGIKEDVYVPTFTPEPRLLGDLEFSAEDLVVTLRPSATEAHYHDDESEILFEAVVDYLGQTPSVRMVLLPRNDNQESYVKDRWFSWCDNGRIIIPKHVVDGLNLLWRSDFVISGGGTMNREAASLG